uniref:Uncharacterized protein n=1 Tax=Panagrolaimus sp. PS1159 TaxID=55785 RepID=A0AC35F421_9BILA
MSSWFNSFFGSNPNSESTQVPKDHQPSTDDSTAVISPTSAIPGLTDDQKEQIREVIKKAELSKQSAKYVVDPRNMEKLKLQNKKSGSSTIENCDSFDELNFEECDMSNPNSESTQVPKDHPPSTDDSSAVISPTSAIPGLTDDQKEQIREVIKKAELSKQSAKYVVDPRNMEKLKLQNKISSSSTTENFDSFDELNFEECDMLVQMDSLPESRLN